MEWLIGLVWRWFVGSYDAKHRKGTVRFVTTPGTRQPGYQLRPRLGRAYRSVRDGFVSPYDLMRFVRERDMNAQTMVIRMAT